MLYEMPNISHNLLQCIFRRIRSHKSNVAAGSLDATMVRTESVRGKTISN